MKRFSVIVLLVCLALVGCKNKKSDGNAAVAPTKVNVTVVGGGQSSVERNYVGNVGSEKEMDLSIPLGGTLTKVAVRNGQKVQKGQLIAQVDATTATSLHAAAKATLRQAEDASKRLRPVYEQGGISEVRWIQMETDLEKARSAEQSARKNMENCTIKAPFSGVISCPTRNVGQELKPMESFGRLLDMTKLRVEFSVPEQEVSLLSVGDEATADIPAIGNEAIKIMVSDKSIEANPLGHTYQIYASIKDKNLTGLLPDMVARVHLNLRPTDGIIIPARCIQVMPEGNMVWVVDGGKANRRLVTVSDFLHDGVMIADGLFPGDTLVVDGMQKLYTDAPVTLE